MTAVIQRVDRADLYVSGELYSRIGRGLLILLGVSVADTVKDAEVLAGKCSGLRIFEDEALKMNRSVDDIGGEILVVSNFTLLADTKKGKRPSFIGAARPEQARPLYERFTQLLKTEKPVQTGVFGGDMKIDFINDGPITVIIRSEDLL